MHMRVFRALLMYECYVCNCFYEWFKFKANSFLAAFLRALVSSVSPSFSIFDSFFNVCLQLDLQLDFFFPLSSPCSDSEIFNARLLARRAESFSAVKRVKARHKNTYSAQCFSLSPSYLCGFSSVMRLSLSLPLFKIPSPIFIFFISVPSSCFLSFSCLFEVDGNMPV